jgi:hypothetical protein
MESSASLKLVVGYFFGKPRKGHGQHRDEDREKGLKL